MNFHLTYLGHAAFLLVIDRYRILIDPYLTGNPGCPLKASRVEADFIVLTHGHGDHVGDTAAIAVRTGALVIANYEICNWLEKKYPTLHTHAQHLGGGYQHPFGYLKLTQALHGSSMPDGAYGGNPAGVLIRTLDGKRLYFAGDTGLFGDMRLIGEEGIDLAALPIGDNYTMGPDDALRAVTLIAPKTVIPIHYSQDGLLKQDAEAWAGRVENETNSRVVLLKPGETLI